jgi:hypothetical protein
VSNALPALKQSADFVTAGARGAGIVELLQRIRSEDIKIAAEQHFGLALGTVSGSNEPALLDLQDGGVLIAGQSGVGKSTIATALTERMVESGMQFCVLDPEGDYDALAGAVCVGGSRSPPTTEQTLSLLHRLDTNVVVNTLAIALEERPDFFLELLHGIVKKRNRTARPHWLLIDEAHHVLPAERGDLGESLPDILPGTIFITVHPEAMSPAALRMIETVIAVGDNAPDVISQFCRAVKEAAPLNMEPPKSGHVLLWKRGKKIAEDVIAIRSEQAHKRHTRKYAEGELGKDKSFYFHGADHKLNLRANNLMTFIQLADGIDDATWEHHLRAHDYSSWFRNSIKDDGLAQDAEKIENDQRISALESRSRMAASINQRYTKAATGAKG